MRVVAGSEGTLAAGGRRVAGVALDGDRVVALLDPGPPPPGADLRPGVLVPALADAHLHPVGIAQVEMDLDLRGAGSLPGALEAIAERAASLPPGEPLVATGLDDERLAGGRLPGRIDRDRAAPGRPVVVHRVCGHVAVASTAALVLAGIGPDTPDPAGGSIDRGADGPTGILRETAVNLVAAPVAALTRGPGPEEVVAAAHRLRGLGIAAVTGMVSTGVGGWCGGRDELGPLVEAGPDLPIDVDVMVMTADPGELRRAAALVEAAGPRLRFLGWKGFADGSLGARTAHLRSGYHDAPAIRGEPRLDPAARELARTALDLGGRVAVHAIGDAALDTVLDLFERLAGSGGDPGRLRVEHASIVPDDALTRMADLGVVASIQPAFLASDGPWLERRLGPERVTGAYPLHRLAAAGVPLAGGSDAPVESPDPWAGMAAAARRAIPGGPGLSPAAALALFAGGAWAAAGRPAPLTPGGPADFLVVDRHPLDAGPAGTAVVETWVGGRRVG